MFKRRTRATRIEEASELDGAIRRAGESGRPLLLDFFQVNCAACKVMDGIVDELAGEYEGTAEVVKVDVTRVPGAAERFAIRSTPTFVVFGRSQKQGGKKSTRRTGAVTPRWRASGLVKKDVLVGVLERNGGERVV